jgi:hypothetical protein
LLPPRDHSSDSSSLSSFSCMQGTLSDEKEFSGLIIGGADAALLLRVCDFHVAASRWPATTVSSHCLVQGMSP